MLLSKLDDTVRSLENKKSSTEACAETFQAKLQLLEAQLESAKAASEQDKEKAKKLSEDLRVVRDGAVLWWSVYKMTVNLKN